MTARLLDRVLDVVWAAEPITVANIAERLAAKPNSVAETIRRNADLFDRSLSDPESHTGAGRALVVRLSAEGRRRHADEAVPF